MNINTTEGSNEENYGEAYVSNLFVYFGFLLGFCITSLSLITICILRECRKLTMQIRLMSMHLTVANLGYGLTLLCTAIYYIIHGTLCSFILKLLPVSFVIFNIFLTASGVDRILSLKYTIRYTLWNKKQNIHLLTVCLYALGVCINLPNWTAEFACNGVEDMFTYSGLIIFVCSMLVFITCDVVIYVYIGLIALKAKTSNQNLSTATSRKTDFTRFWSATLKSFVLSIITILLLGPFIASRAVDAWNIELNNPEVSLNTLFLVILHQIVSPIFILISYKECRYHIAVLCCRCFQNKREKLEKDYKQHYSTYIISADGFSASNGL